MSLSWLQRKTRLATLLKSRGDEDVEGIALDRITHGQTVIGKTSKTIEIDALRFQDKDLSVIGTLEYGQFGVISVVTCRLDGHVYVRKSIDKRVALRTRDQCSPQIERDILLQALRTNSQWAPHILCAFQTRTHLNIVMDYAEAGNLWDVLESSPHDGKVLESDLMWWTPQLVSAIHWCHSQGFVHRDIKPHNFVLTPEAHVLLIDFGSAAPLLPPDSNGVQLLPQRYCLVPCGTCDYISPEILKAHEEALVALEMEDEDNSKFIPESEEDRSYGRETDWWSLGAMLYEMAYGCAPFFAKDIRQTYLKIMNHEKYLSFHPQLPLSIEYQDFLHSLLTYADERLGRRSIREIKEHAVFHDINWTNLLAQNSPSTLHLPQFTYAEPAKLTPSPDSPDLQSQVDTSHSKGFAFSALFQSSNGSSPGLSILRSRSSPHPARFQEEDTTASFIGFSWGPTMDAFPVRQQNDVQGTADTSLSYMNTPRPLRIPSTYLTPNPAFITPRISFHTGPPNSVKLDRFTTPDRPSMLPLHNTLPRTSTIRRTGDRRNVSDREAMKQLVDCVGQSARKKVLESGRKPRLLTRSGSTGNGTISRKELRFDPSVAPIPIPNLSDAGAGQVQGPSLSRRSSLLMNLKPILVNHEHDHQDHAIMSASEDTGSEGPPSPSPTPRPGSAMSILSRRSGTPTMTMSSGRTGLSGTVSSTSTMLLGVPRSASARSLSFSGRSLDTPESFGILVKDQTTRQPQSQGLEQAKPPRVSLRTFEGMENRLTTMLRDIRGVESRLAEVTKLMH